VQDKEVEVLETESDEDCVIVMDNHEDKISHVSKHNAANFQQDFPATCIVLLG
jgi:hypothetical protein